MHSGYLCKWLLLEENSSLKNVILQEPIELSKTGSRLYLVPTYLDC